ncbi:DNAJB13 [Symbiodinium sp. CCMP2456]|nr:DNAJB13 [Symbiodinium sp. CCMP2456]
MDPREAVLAQYDLQASNKLSLKHLRSNLVEDQFSPTANVALRLARDSYNKKCPMHLVLDLSRYNSRGQLWLGSVQATSNPALLEAHGITHIYSAGFQRDQTKDKQRFYFLPTHDGTGVLRGNVSFEEVMNTAVEVAANMMKGGYRYVVCCRNGAHRSAMLIVLILMVLTGQPAKTVAAYFVDEKTAYVIKARQAAKLPAICLNSAGAAGQKGGKGGKGGKWVETKKMPSKPPQLAQPVSSGADSADAGSAGGEASTTKSKAAGSAGLGVAKAKAEERPPEAAPVKKELKEQRPPEAAPVKKELKEQRPPEAAPLKKEFKEQRPPEKAPAKEELKTETGRGAAPASASSGLKLEPSQAEKARVDLKPWKASSVKLTEGPGAAGSAGKASEKKETLDAGEKRKEPPEQPSDTAPVQTKPKMEERFGGNFVSKVREVMETLIAMRGRLFEAAKNAGTAEAVAAFEDEVDYGDDEELDVEAASQALSAGDAQSVKLMELLLDEQKRLSAQIEALASSQATSSGSQQEQLAERVWAALQANDAEASEAALRQLPPSTIEAMKDAAGATPLHVAARNRWLGLTAYLLEVAPSLAVATTYSRQPPKWTALMSLANMPKARDEAVADREAEIVRLLLQHMPVDALNIQSGTGASVTHLAVPKGNHALTEQVLWALYTKGGWSAVEHHLGLANHLGKSALDLALRSNVAFAKVLRDHWWAVSLTPAPASDERDYSRRYRTTGQRSWW